MPAIDLGYECRPQFVPFHARTARWVCLVAHRRCGKTVACVADLVDAALRDKTGEGRYGYISPYFVQSKDVAWGYIKKFTAAIPGIEYNEAELRCDFPNGSRIRLYGADNYDRMRGLYFNGVILDESADMPPAAWAEVIRPALADRRGWAVFIGTPKGKGPFYQTWIRSQTEPDWFSLILRASETGLLAQEELDAAAAEMTPEQYAQEFECSFDAAIIGAYYGKPLADAAREGRITSVPVDPDLPIHTAWDLGMGDSTAIWVFQIAGNELRVVDAYENSGFGLDHYCAVLKERGYVGGRDFVPHDARVRELGSGRSRIQTLIALGRKPEVVADHKLMDGINALRLTIPTTWFDETNCAQGLEALRQYRTDFDEKKRVFRDTPRHDWSSHFADGARYMAVAWREIAKPKPTTEDELERIAKLNKPYLATLTFDQLTKMPKKRQGGRI